MIQLQPLHDRVVIKRIEETEKTRSGLFIPDTAKEKPQQGEAPPSATARSSKAGSVFLSI